MTDLDRFVQLTQSKRQLEGALTDVKAELATIQERLLEEFTTEGVRGKRTASGVLVSIRRQIWARAADGDKAATAKKLATMPAYRHLVENTFNTHSLSAIFRARAKENGKMLDELLEPELRDVIALTEDFQLSCTGLS